MIFEAVYKDVIDSFGSLWSFKERGESLEIITPFATTSHKFISVFVTKKASDYIVSDGGWIDGGNYDNGFERDVSCYSKIISYYLQSFEIKETASSAGQAYFYKKTDKQTAIPSLIFDMANFISSIVSLSNVEYDVERQSRDLFSTNATDYLKEIIRPERIHVGAYLDSSKRVKPNAIISVDNGKVVLVNYITGSNPTYFRHSIAGANLIFDMAEDSKESVLVEGKVVLVDDTSNGYKMDKVSNWLDYMISNTKSSKINWAERDRLKTYN